MEDKVGAPISPEVEPMRNIEFGSSQLANSLGCCCCPVAYGCGFWELKPRHEALIFHFSVLTGKEVEPGCHGGNCCGRDIKQISTAQVSHDLKAQRIIDSAGNPLIVSAVLVFRFSNAEAAVLNVKNAHDFVVTQAGATLKEVVGQFTCKVFLCVVELKLIFVT